jgi:hypothetical protein
MMRGVIVEGELWRASTGRHSDDGLETVLVFLELEDGFLHARRGYGERATILTLELDELESALAALKAEVARKPPASMPGQTELELAEGDA